MNLMPRFSLRLFREARFICSKNAAQSVIKPFHCSFRFIGTHIWHAHVFVAGIVFQHLSVLSDLNQDD